jgi:hypothetical protein
MKPLIKYISLLLFSGLIIPFCDQHAIITPKPLKPATSIFLKIQSPGFSFIKEIVKNSFPVLKSLN